MQVLSQRSLFCPPGGNQSPQSSGEWTPRRGAEAAAVGPVHLWFCCSSARHHCFPDLHLLLHLPHPVLGISSGLSRRRNRHQRRSLVAAGNQPAVHRSPAPGGGAGPLEENVSGEVLSFSVFNDPSASLLGPRSKPPSVNAATHRTF